MIPIGKTSTGHSRNEADGGTRINRNSMCQAADNPAAFSVLKSFGH